MMLRHAVANGLNVCRRIAGAHLAVHSHIHPFVRAQLARHEMIAAFEAILAPINNLAYAPDCNNLQHLPHLYVRRLKELRITFNKTS